ncbi:MAG: PIN domain-containing protein [Rhizobiales bacterium]|nr:PIN domain-containing protein [Hyphomicrobiales bacterium]MBI3674048.1 PIN domain-containing protein [Hyphomicrobiales bacterium]
MNAEVMLDTNIIAYAASRLPADRLKREKSLALIETTPLGISAQVLQEFYVTVTRKMQTPLSHEEALDWIEELEQFPCVPIDASLVYNGAKHAARYRISYWDGSIIAAAERLGASVLYTEDLNDGQAYGSVKVVNPFKPE